MFNLNNSIVLVVGGRGYLGRAFCETRRKCDAKVISADLPTRSKAAAKSKFQSQFDDIDEIDVDVRKKDSITNMIAQVLAKLHFYPLL